MGLYKAVCKKGKENVDKKEEIILTVKPMGQKVAEKVKETTQEIRTAGMTATREWNGSENRSKSEKRFVLCKQ